MLSKLDIYLTNYYTLRFKLYLAITLILSLGLNSRNIFFISDGYIIYVSSNSSLIVRL